MQPGWAIHTHPCLIKDGKPYLGPSPIHACALHTQVNLDKERKRDLKQQQYSCIFYGNPGTGKTTVARIYAALLEKLGVLPGGKVVETSGAAMVNAGVSDLKKKLEDLDKGGVLFIDEAYQLKPQTNPLGAQVRADLSWNNQWG